MANLRPSPPGSAKINGQDTVTEYNTRSTGSGVYISAVLDDPNATQRVRLVVQFSSRKDFAGARIIRSAWGKQTARATVMLSGLAQNTHYYCRLHTQDGIGLLSKQYKAVDFYTNLFPLAPTLYGPGDNTETPYSTPTVFTWKHNDPESDTAVQKSAQLRWRRASTPLRLAGAWTTVTVVKPTWTAPAGTFGANSTYEWQVRTQDGQGAWGEWSEVWSLNSTGTTTPSVPLSPVRGVAVDFTGSDTGGTVLFTWQFRNPSSTAVQGRADLRWRVVGTNDWTQFDGDTTTPGALGAWAVEMLNFAPDQHYEWQVRSVVAVSGLDSGWSEAGDFWTFALADISETENLLAEFTDTEASLGCGDNKVYIYDRGGTRLRGEITPLSRITYNRKRDDISNCVFTTNGFGLDCGELLTEVEPWLHEVVVYRDGVRVWEGPVSRVTMTMDGVEIEAKDVLNYVYRRILRQGYNDSYRLVNAAGVPITKWEEGAIQLGLKTVVERAERIIRNSMIFDDSNVLPYLAPMHFPDDARQSRVVPDFSKTAWEEIDDLAATAGLDYTVIGRRILLWDTHRPVGRLPEMRDEHFSAPPVVSKYGMLFATAFGVTNNNGVYGLAERVPGQYPVIEQLASAYGEAETAAPEVLTSVARLELERTMSDQAERNIAHRFPSPVIVRVPDNAALSPDTPVTINQLVPGVWIPLRSRGPTWNLAQWQKLDLVNVEQTETGETISVTMSPAPNGGEDPDADSAAADAAEG